MRAGSTSPTWEIVNEPDTALFILIRMPHFCRRSYLRGNETNPREAKSNRRHIALRVQPFLPLCITVSGDIPIGAVARQGYSWISVAQGQSKVRPSAGGITSGGSYGHIRRACHLQRAGH